MGTETAPYQETGRPPPRTSRGPGSPPHDRDRQVRYCVTRCTREKRHQATSAPTSKSGDLRRRRRPRGADPPAGSGRGGHQRLPHAGPDPEQPRSGVPSTDRSSTQAICGRISAAKKAAARGQAIRERAHARGQQRRGGQDRDPVSLTAGSDPTPVPRPARRRSVLLSQAQDRNVPHQRAGRKRFSLDSARAYTNTEGRTRHHRDSRRRAAGQHPARDPVDRKERRRRDDGVDRERRLVGFTGEPSVKAGADSSG